MAGWKQVLSCCWVVLLNLLTEFQISASKISFIFAFLIIRNKIITMRSSQSRDSEFLEFLEKFKLLIRNWILWCPKISILFFDHRIYLMIASLRNRGPLKVLNAVRAGFCAT